MCLILQYSGELGDYAPLQELPKSLEIGEGKIGLDPNLFSS
jgi:hypothetical protein